MTAPGPQGAFAGGLPGDTSNDLLVQMAEHSREAFWVSSPDGARILYVSPAFAEIFGRSCDSLYAMPRLWLEAVHPDDRAGVASAVKRLRLGESEYDETFRILRPDGTVRWVHDRGFPIRDASGRVIRVAGYLEDISDQHQAAESARILTSAMEQATESVMIVRVAPGAEPRIVFVNPAFTELTGYSLEEALDGTAPMLLGHPGSLPASTPLCDAMRGGEAFSGEQTIRCKDGSAFLAEWDVGPVRDAGGSVTHSVAILRDVTSRRQSQAELLEAKAIAQAADHAKSAFLASMSHELRTPLNAIIGFSELLADEPAGSLTERQRKFVQHVLSAGRSLLDLIDQILDLTRADVGQMVLNLTPFRAADALQEVLFLVRALAERRQLEMVIEVSGDVPMLHADLRKFKQILYSMLSGAIRGASSAGRLAFASRHLESEGAPWIEFAVSRGPGNAEVDRRTLSDLQPPSSSYGRANPYSELGLGLSRKLADLHGGHLTGELVEGGGLVLRLLLPAEAGSAFMPPVRPIVVEGSESAPMVLVVDDNPEASDLLTHYLVEAGYGVSRAFSGEEALRLARELRPAAITMDSELPDRNGLDVLSLLRLSPDTRDIPAIVVSVVDRRSAVAAAGISAWLVKPVDRSQLLRVVERLVRSSGAEEVSP